MIPALYSQSALAKIWGVALRGLAQRSPPTRYPEYTKPGIAPYEYTDYDFWTSGFFPGSLYLVYERARLWDDRIPRLPQLDLLKMRHACEWWTANLHSQASRTDTHDLGFLVMPWAQKGWELDGDRQCYQSMIAAAYALASRFDRKIGAIRSWDTCLTKRYTFTDPKDAFLVIIDSMMNLNLLFYVAELVGNPTLADIAKTHATTLLNSHIRPDDSTFHVVDFDQATARIKQRFTNQGFSDESCWARGQAWGIAGYAQCYGWTKEPRFLNASKRLADYFIKHLPDDGVPYWDFHSPKPGPRDTSAALIAAYGMLLLYKHAAEEAKQYMEAAIRVVRAVAAMSLAPEATVPLSDEPDGKDIVDFKGSDTIVLNATINDYEFAPRRWADHGLVYADYYFLLIGNLMLEMGLV
ncbi:glycoside hydrolase family 88 protein [Lophiostoma macrostomum CBS 122681]|uniref:Glycoside hydrolase family 88 protein n=1 Tax=Lophiostoma macrostomum CBS 122681 TaxID=1314788 RepID=A0A6A6T0U5_9PLEO|nr:glycoside hydrolase family 88 protein [Lophiostoma macrostomum CBS 122681]